MFLEHLVDRVDDGGAVGDDRQDLGPQGFGDGLVIGVVFEEFEDELQLGQLARDGRQIGAGSAATADEGGDGHRRDSDQRQTADRDGKWIHIVYRAARAVRCGRLCTVEEGWRRGTFESTLNG